MKGEVTSVTPSPHSRHHVVVHIAHGRRKPKVAPKKSDAPFTSDYDDRPTSSMLVHKKDAGQYAFGRKVDTHAKVLDEGDDLGDGAEAGEDLEGMQKRLRKAERR